MELSDLRKNLTAVYPFGGPSRLAVPEDKIEWNEDWPEYTPPDFTTDSILQGDKKWADKELCLTQVGLWPKWNSLDGEINRMSHHGNYKTDQDGYPLNPAGRTGIRGRGSLGRWATNHAAHCLLTRWKKGEDATVVVKGGKQVLQFIRIIRKDTGDAALPGGMIKVGEDAMKAVKRHALEQVFPIQAGCKWCSPDPMEETIEEVFSTGNSVYKGYMDDRRNTDNSWIETEAITCLLDDNTTYIDGTLFSDCNVKAGSKEKPALWIDVDQNVKLYASQENIIKILVQKLDAYW